MDEETSQNKAGKQVSLESLTKEELVTKCKNFITLLKKAKTSKDDAVGENDKLKSEHAKVIRQFEEERNKIETEMETMQEIVTSSTESKMMLVTKNESLQRQLNLQLSEVEGMKNMLDTFAEEKEALLKELNRLRLMTTKQQKVVEQMKEDREKMMNSETSWQEEKTLLIDKVETLEAQVVQSDILKTNYKKLMGERDEALKKLSEISSQHLQQASFETEKKALEIVHHELKSQNIILEEKYKNCVNENEELCLKLAEFEQVTVKLTSTEDQLSQRLSELDAANEAQSNLRQEYDKSVLLVEKLKKDLEHENEIQSKQHDEFEKLKKELTSYKEKMNEMNERVKDSEMNCNEESELKQKLDKLEAENMNKKSEIENLQKENEELKIFFKSISLLCNLNEEIEDTNEFSLDIQNSLSKLKNIHSLHNELKNSSLKLANLVCNLFCFELLDGEMHLDTLIQAINDTYLNFERVFNDLKDSKLQELCNGCSVIVKSYCCSADKLENLLLSSTLPQENCDVLLEAKNLPMQLTHLFQYLQKICNLLSNFFKFDLVPDIGEVINVAEEKNKNLESFILKSIDNFNHIADLQKLLKSSTDETIAYRNSIEDRDNTINSLEHSLKTLKDEFNEMEQLKILGEETISDITQKYDEIKSQHEHLQNQLQKESEEVEGYKAGKSQLNEEFQKLMNEVESYKAGQSQLNEECQKLMNEVENYKAGKSQLNEECQKLMNEVESYKAGKSQLNEECQKLMNEVESLKQQLSESTSTNTSELDEHKNLIEHLKKENELLSENFGTFKKDICTYRIKLKSIITKNTEQKIGLEALNSDEELLENENQSLGKEMLFWNNEVEEILKMKKELEEENERIKTENNELKNIKITLEESFNKFKKNNEDLNEEATQLQKEIQEYIEKEALMSTNFKNLNSELETLRADKASLNDQLSDIKEQLQESKVSSDDMGKVKDGYMLLEQQKLDLENKITEYLQLNKMLETKFETLKNENELLLNKLSTLDKELKQSQQQNDHLSESFNTLKSSFKELDNVKKEYNNMNEEYQNSKLELKSLHEKLDENFNVRKSLEDKLNNFGVEFNDLNNVNEKLKKEIENLERKIQSHEEQNSDYERIKDEFEEITKNNELLRDKITTFETELEEITKNNELLRVEVANLETELSQIKSLNKDREDQLAATNVQIVSLREEKEALQLNVKNLEAKVIGCVQSIKSLPDDAEIKTQVDDLTENSFDFENSNNASSLDASTRYTEVISELNDMLQIIRKRGQRISLLEDEVQQKNAEIEETKTKLEEAEGRLSSGEKELASKDEELQKMQLSAKSEDESSTLELKEKIAALEEENLQLKKTTEHEGPSKLAVPNDTQSEVMSTSTISKMEESYRMKELEDSFEERYMKLKNLAIKLKKKLLEQTAEIKALEESKKKLVSEKEELAKKGQGHVITSKNIQALQSEIDKLNDSLDANKKELKEREKQLVTSAQETSDLKSKLVQLEDDNSRLILTIKNTEESFSGQKSLSESLQGQVDALEKRLLLEEEKILKGQEERKGLEAKVEEEKGIRDQLFKELEELRQDNKKHSLIDLEMKDYERSIEDLTSQVQEKEDVITSLKDKLTTEETRVANLSDEISLLKEQVHNETERAEKLKKASSDYKEKLSEIRLEQEKRIRDREKDREIIEILNQELEKQKLCLADLSAQSSKTEQHLRREKDIAENKVEVLEETLEKNERVVENLKEELKELQKQFEAYKIRAQNVLKQKNKVPQQSYEDLKSEKEQLQTDLEASQLKIHKLQSELTAAKAELGFLNSEKEKLNLKLSNLGAEYSKKESLLESKIESLEKKFEAKSAEYQLIISDMSAQTEAMNKSFKAQLESDKERYLNEVQKLESKLEVSEEKLWLLKNSSSSAAKNNSNGKSEVGENHSLSLAAHHTRKTSHSSGALVEDHRIDVANMIRGEGEGSEWVEPHSRRSPSQHLYNPPTLEQLINNPFPSQSHHQRLSMDDSTSVISAATEFSSKEIARLENRLSTSENRIQQLTALLNESEAENARLVQLSNTLKEEIRRSTRNEKREKHLENNEYLKNVVLKFIMLKTGDEKFRLVPVLKTLLQLSPEEAGGVAIIAKGEDPQNTPQGWSDYLHLWSGR